MSFGGSERREGILRTVISGSVVAVFFVFVFPNLPVDLGIFTAILFFISLNVIIWGITRFLLTGLRFPLMLSFGALAVILILFSGLANTAL